MEHRTDHAERALGRIIQQYKSSPRLAELIRIYAEQFQEVEDAQAQIRAAFDVATATGVNLDAVGGEVGLIRSGMDDTAYRAAIYAKIEANWSDGLEANLTALIQDFYGAGAALTFEELTRATCIYYLEDFPLIAEPGYVADFLHVAKAAGVRVFFHYLGAVLASTFTLSTQGAVLETSSALGLANTAQTSGGHLAGVEAA